MAGESEKALLAEFDSAEALLRATRAAREAKRPCLDAYAPMPVEGLAEAVREGWSRFGMAAFVLVGAILGGSGAYLLQYYALAVDYPLNVGGRPAHSWAAFIPITFELTVLGAALTGFFAVLIANRLPRLHHPVFEIERFERASIDGFFLCLADRDEPGTSGETARAFLERQGARHVWEVET